MSVPRDITYEKLSPAGKTVGKRVARAPSLSVENDSVEKTREWRRAFPTPFIPRGVYRFSSHEEADQWLWKMMTRKPKN